MRSLLVRSALAVCVSLAFVAPSFAAGCPSTTWAAGQEIAIDGYFRGLTVIDYDDDGILDLAGAIEGPPATIVTFRGLGNGTFGPPVVLFTSSSQNVHGTIGELNSADIDLDGDADLLARYWGNLLIFRGTGTGLAPPVEHQRGYSLHAFEFTNFDGDLDPDLVEIGSGRIVFYENTAGNFTEALRITTGKTLTDVLAFDFDGDGFLDVATGTYVSTSSPGSVEIRFGSLSGFSDPLVLPAGTYPQDLALGNFNGDHLPDLAVSNWTDTTVTVFRNTDSRQFTASTLSARYPERYGSAWPLTVTDVNGDFIPDILVGTANGGWLATYAGVGDGTFRSPTYFLGTDQLYEFVLADFDADGDREVAYGGYEKLIIASSACATQVTLTAEAPVVSSTNEATLNVAISGFRAGMPQPYGTATLRKGAETIGVSNVNADGKAVFIVAPMPAGEHVFTADFSGNSEVSAATSASVTQTVTNETTQTTLVTPATAPVYGTAWPIDVNVTGYGTQESEFVKLYIDGVPRDHYNYYLYDAFLTPGEHTIYAKYLGRPGSPASKSATLVVVAQKATPSFTISGAAPVRLGQSHALQITLGGPANAFTPTGSVQLFSGATLLATLNLAGGTASTNFTFPRGAHPIRMVYSGDGYYQSAETTPTLYVLANEPVAIEARALENGIHIAHVAPSGVTHKNLYRRVAGAPVWQLAAWNNVTGMDDFAAQRGVVYEYYLEVAGPGVDGQSAVDDAMLFTDDPVSAGATVIRRVHMTQLRDSVNLLRVKAGLQPFAFDAAFESSNIVRAQHLLALQNAAAQARSALGMAAAPFDAFTSGSIVSAAHLRQTRDAVR